MGESAKITSIDAVQAFAVALEAFQDEATAALDELELQVRRALEWIHHDRKQFWRHQVQTGWQKVTEARLQLEQAQTFRRIADRTPSCVDEKKALAKAKRRLDFAQEKVETVRHWTGAIDHAVGEYRGGIAQLATWLMADLPLALAALDRMSRALESYVAIEAMPDATGLGAPGRPPGAARDGATLPPGDENPPEEAVVPADSCTEEPSP